MERTTEEMKKQAQIDRQQTRTELRELARQLGDSSNRLGTVVEDIIAPSLRRLACDEMGCGQELFFAVHLSKTRIDDLGQSREFDALFVGEVAVLLNETKVTARPEYTGDFAEFVRSDEFFAYFPEYADKPVVPVFSSLYLPANIATYLTGQGIYAVAMGDDIMRVLNLKQVQASRLNSEHH